MGDLTFSALSVPFAAVVIALLSLAFVAVVVRGDAVMRLAILANVAAALPWAACFVVAASTRDREVATLAYRIGFAPVALVGPGLLMLILAVSGRFDSRRGLVAIGYLCALVSTVIAFATPWVVDGVQDTPSGLIYEHPGWFHDLHLAQILVWAGTGVVLSRGRAKARERAQRQRMAIVVILVCTTMVDTLLAHGVIGYYPVAWVPGLFAIAVAHYSIFRADMFRARGVDRPAMVELISLCAVAGLLYVVLAHGNRTWMGRPLVTGVFLAPLPTLGLVVAWTMRIRRRREERTSDVASLAIDRFAEEVRDLDDERAVAARFTELLAEHAPIGDLRTWLVEDGGLRALVPPSAAPPKIDARVRAWLVANPDPLVVAELPTTRLGGLRALVEDVVDRLVADVVIPLVDRDGLIGLAAGNLPAFRVLRDEEREFVRAVATTAARGLTFVALTREATHLASTAREVELAEAVSQARATGDVTIDAGPWQVLGHYRPAARVAGDVWSCTDLGGGRLLLFAGDVVGRGVPSALVSAAVAGVCDAAPAFEGEAREPRGLLELAHRTVRDLGGGTQRVTAFAALIDRERALVRWASAGHRGAYLVHPPAVEGERARLDLLGGRSTPLGEPTLVLAHGERALAADDHLIACSDGVVEVRDAHGEPWGDRRLQRLVRDQLIGAGERAARMAVAAAVAHAGEAAIADDMLVVVVRPVS